MCSYKKYSIVCLYWWKNTCHVAKTQNISQLWKLISLTIEEKIDGLSHWQFQKLSILILFTEISTSIINLLNKMQMKLIWKRSNPKTKHNILCRKYKNVGLKNVASLQCYRIKRLRDNNFHQWKVIPLYLFQRYLCKKIVSF